jgi:hypothetical protein
MANICVRESMAIIILLILSITELGVGCRLGK